MFEILRLLAPSESLNTHNSSEPRTRSYIENRAAVTSDLVFIFSYFCSIDLNMQK